MAKKLVPVIVLIIIVAAAFYFSASQNGMIGSTVTAAPTTTIGSPTHNSTTSAIDDNDATSITASTASINPDVEDSDGDNGQVSRDERPATEVYKNAEDALAAVKAGSKDYDDLILQQFTALGEDCTWCDSFYASLKTTMSDPATTSDQRSYFAEMLSVSGRVENLQALVEAIKSAPTPDVADQYSEALELTTGKKEVTDYLGTLLSGDNQNLKESAVAAITNQGSREAAELLYKHTIEKGDPDGYYSVGIGLGEFVPDESSTPYIQEIMLKRDQYSHLATKSLLNSGDDGLKLVFDALASSKNPDFDRQMLKDALDHVNMGDQTRPLVEGYLSSNQQPVLQEFGKQILEELNQEQESDKNQEGAEDETIADEAVEAPGATDSVE